MLKNDRNCPNVDTSIRPLRPSLSITVTGRPAKTRYNAELQAERCLSRGNRLWEVSKGSGRVSPEAHQTKLKGAVESDADNSL